MRYFYLTARLLLAAVIVLEAGCIKYHAKPISSAQTLANFEARSLDDPTLKAFLEDNLHHEIKPWPLRRWDFNLLTLAAFYYHPDLDEARAKWGVSTAGIKTAKQSPNPTLNFIPTYVTNTMGENPWDPIVSLDIPIETAGKRRHRIAQAKYQSEMDRLGIADTAWKVRSRLRKSLVDLFAAQQTQVILKRQLSLQEENLHLLESRSLASAIAPVVVSDVRLQRDQTLISIRDAQKKEAEARADLAVALGLTRTALDGITIPLNFLDHPPKKFVTPEIRRTALLNRADLLVLLAEYAASEEALQLEIAKQYPDIKLGPGYEFDQGPNKWSLGFSIDLPIFNHNQGPIAEAKAKRTETGTRFMALQAQIVGEIDKAIASYQGSQKKLLQADSLVANVRSKEQMLTDLTTPGELRRVALLQTKLDIEEHRLTRLNALVEVQEALGLLEDSVQRPIDWEYLTYNSLETNPRTQDQEEDSH